MNSSVVLILVMCWLLTPGGATVCPDVAPGAQGQTSTSPYTIRLDSVEMDMGGSIRVYLETDSRRGQGFLKLMLMAFQVGRYTDAIGRFSAPSSNINVVDCQQHLSGAVTHIVPWWPFNPTLKTAEAVTWTPTQDFQGDVIFKATFVQDKRTYWIGVPSSPLRVGPYLTTTTIPTTIPTTTEQPTIPTTTTHQPTITTTSEQPITDPSTSEQPTTDPSTSEQPTTDPSTTTDQPTEPTTTTDQPTEPTTTDQPTTWRPETTTKGGSASVNPLSSALLLSVISTVLSASFHSC